MRDNPKAALVSLVSLVVCGCGDPVAGLDYKGDPLATLQGRVVLGGGSTPAGGLYAVVGWRTEASPEDTWTGEIVDAAGGFPASYYIDMLAPPPDGALNVDPETGGELGFSFVVLMEDVNGNGQLDVDQSAAGLPTGPDRFRGGAETLLLAYAAAPFAATSKIGKALGGELAVGYHLMQADPRFRCSWDADRRDWTCPNGRTELKKVSFETPVDLKVIERPSEWAPVHTPDWLFFE